MHRQQNSLVITDGLTDTAHSVNVLIKPYFSWLINHHWWILCWLQARSTFLSMWIIPDLLVRAHFKHFLIMFPLRSKKTSALNASHEYKFCFIHKLHDSDIFFVFFLLDHWFLLYYEIKITSICIRCVQEWKRIIKKQKATIRYNYRITKDN